MTNKRIWQHARKALWGLGALLTLPAVAGAVVTTTVLKDFEDGTTSSFVSLTTANSPAAANANTAVTNVTEGGSKRLQLQDNGGDNQNGAVVTIPGGLPGPGNWLVTADVKVDATDIGSFGMALVAGGTTTTEIDDTNAGYVMNLYENKAVAASLGYQTIGASVRKTTAGASDLTIYFSTDASSYSGVAADGNMNGEHRTGQSAWASSAGKVYIDNIKLIGPGNFGEDRHLWISISDGLTNQATLDAKLVAAKNNNFNAVDVLVRYRANRYYQRTSLASPEPKVSGLGSFDTLQYTIDRCRELGLKVYISFSCFLVTDGGSTYPSVLPSGSIQWVYNGGTPRAQTLADDSEGLWMDVGRPDVRTYTTNVALDIVKNYDIDGIIFDRIRYQNANFGYNPVALADMGIAGVPVTTNATFRQKRRDAVTAFLQQAYEAITTEKPWVVVGTVPIAYGTSLTDTYTTVFQRWPDWSSRKTINRTVSFGVHDIIQPQFYRLSPTAPAGNQTLMLKGIYGDTTAFPGTSTQRGDFGLFPGALVNFSPLFYHPSTSDTAQSNANAQNICDIRTGTTYKTNGWGLYAATSTITDIGLIRSTSSSACAVDLLASADPGFDYLMKAGYDNTKPNAPTISGNTTTPARVQLTWSTPAAAADGETPAKYLVYRSSTNPVKAYYANLVNKDFDVVGTSFNDTSSTGLTAGTWYYLVVALDDYNNRSVSSNQVGPLTPSFPNVVVQSRPGPTTGTAGPAAAPGYSESAAFSDSSVNSAASGVQAFGSRFSTTIGQSAKFQPALASSGFYVVELTADNQSSHNANATYTISNAPPATTRTGNFLIRPSVTTSISDAWGAVYSNPLYFSSGAAGAVASVQFQNVDGDGAGVGAGDRMNMDAVRWRFVEDFPLERYWAIDAGAQANTYPTRNGGTVSVTLNNVTHAGILQVNETLSNTTAAPGITTARLMTQKWALVPTGGLVFGTATLVLEYDPSRLNGLVEASPNPDALDTVYRIDSGNVVTKYTGASAVFNYANNTVTVTGVNGFSEWFIGNNDASTTVADWKTLE